MKAIAKTFYNLLGILFLCYTQSLSQGGYSLSFDGIDDHVSVPHDATLTPSSITVEAWFYPTDISGQVVPPIVKKASASLGYALEVNTPNEELLFYVFIQGLGWRTSPAFTIPTLNTWYHAAGTYDGNDIELYVNGELIGSTSIAGTIDHSPLNLYIGWEPVNYRSLLGRANR